MANECKCDKCGKVFDESDIAEISTQEYSGGKMWMEPVSPCCLSYFDYVNE